MYHSSWREKTLDDETVVAALLYTLFAWAGELSLKSLLHELSSAHTGTDDTTKNCYFATTIFY